MRRKRPVPRGGAGCKLLVTLVPADSDRYDNLFSLPPELLSRLPLPLPQNFRTPHPPTPKKDPSLLPVSVLAEETGDVINGLRGDENRP